MLGDWLTADGAESSNPALITPSESVSWAEFQRQIQLCAEQLQSLENERVGLLLAPNLGSIVQLFSLASVGIHSFLIAADTAHEALSEWSADLGLKCVLKTVGIRTNHNGPTLSRIDFDHEPLAGTPGAMTILTSGTTGKPKAVQHTWESLTRPVRRVALADQKTQPRWLLTYRPNLYAGLQVMMQCLLNYGVLVMPESGATADDVARLAAKERVEFASATPSYWRWLLTLASDESMSAIPLKQITLGGEAVDQATLDALRNKFPDTRLVHIYATTELGRCFSVTDGKAGFPARFLDQVSADGVEMRIESEDGESGGELVARSANAMFGYERSDSPQEKVASPQQQWFHTGDLVHVVEDRVLFVGRKTEMINVGGNKVYPVEVENVIRAVPGVADVRVYGEASSIVGQLVKCDLVVENGFQPEVVEKAVRQTTADQLSTYQRPRFISIVALIPRTAAGKTDRN